MTCSRRFGRSFGAVLLLASSACAASRMASRIERALASRALRGATAGVHVIRLDTGAVVYGHNHDHRFILASNTKILTSAAALYWLGPEFQFNTLVLRDAAIGKGGVIDGNIIVRGDGDPNVSGRHFGGDVMAVMRQVADLLKQQGVRRVTGDVIGDDRIFDREFMREGASRYTFPVSGLPFNDNCIDMLVSPTVAGQAASVTFVPATQYVALDNRCKTHSSPGKNNAWYRFTSDAATLQARGHVYEKAKPLRFHVALPDPSLYFATVLAETLRAAGIQIDGKPRWPKPDEQFQGLDELAKIASGLDITLPQLNKHSNNFFADCLFKRIGAKVSGQGSYASGAAAVAQFLSDIAAPADGVVLSDGCGLSRDNVATPRVLTHVLRHVALSPGKQLFLNSLAVAGEDGTLARRMTKPPCRGRVRAKTGYIKRVSALSGYADAESGTTYVFSILMNGFRVSNREMKRIQEAICKAIIEEG